MINKYKVQCFNKDKIYFEVDVIAMYFLEAIDKARITNKDIVTVLGCSYVGTEEDDSV